MSAKNTPLRPARLFVLLAREAPIGVILRKGPHNWTQMIKWHTDTDTFDEGQWVRGRMFEYTGDVSPDGKLLYYSLWNDKLQYAQESGRADPKKLTSYSAISKTPYFTALSFSRIIVGGLFVDNTTLYLYTDSEWHPIRTIPQLKIENQPYEIDSDGTFPDPKDHFLTKRGWKRMEKGERDYYGRYLSPYIWNKSLSAYKLYTRYFGYDFGSKQGGGHNQLKYSVSVNDGKSESTLQNVNWADFDQRGRLVLAKEGKLFSATLENGDLQLTELADFNANKPDPQPAPDWAQKW